MVRHTCLLLKTKPCSLCSDIGWDSQWCRQVSAAIPVYISKGTGPFIFLQNNFLEISLQLTRRDVYHRDMHCNHKSVEKQLSEYKWWLWHLLFKGPILQFLFRQSFQWIQGELCQSTDGRVAVCWQALWLLQSVKGKWYLFSSFQSSNEQG